MDIDLLIKDISKKYKTDILRKGNEIKEVEKIPFTSPRMNYLTRGGIPVGKMVEFVGKESSGKTTSALDIIKNYQLKYDKTVVYLDAENTLDQAWGEMLGVDFSRVIVLQPTNQPGEELLDIVNALIKSGDVGLVVVDSIPFIQPQSIYEADLNKQSYGGNSVLITKWCSKVIPLMNQYNCTMLIINQVRDKLGVTYTAFNIPGGRALGHSCSVIIMFKKGTLLNEKGEEVSNSFETPQGHKIVAKFEKNKISANDRKLDQYTLMYHTGIDVLTDTIELAILNEIITQSGAWFYYEEEKWQGKVKVVDYFKNNETELQKLIEKCNGIK